jgi:hypothetical protein
MVSGTTITNSDSPYKAIKVALPIGKANLPGPSWSRSSIAAAYEGFCEDLARQNAVAHLPQLQLRFRHRHIWVSMLSHVGFSHHRGVLKATV